MSEDEKLARFNRVMGVIRDEMDARNWSQADLSRKTGIATSTISRWWTRRSIPEHGSMQKLSDALGLDVNVLLELAGHKVLTQPGSTMQERRLRDMVKKIHWDRDLTRYRTVETILRMYQEDDRNLSSVIE